MAEKKEELPKTIVRRLVKDSVFKCSKDGDFLLLKDSLLAFSASSRIFIQYLSATAHDLSKDSNRQAMNADDVFKALEVLDFPEFVEPLKASLEEFRKNNSSKRSGSSVEKEPKKNSAKRSGSSVEKEPKKNSAKRSGSSVEKEPKKKSKVQGKQHGSKKHTE